MVMPVQAGALLVFSSCKPTVIKNSHSCSLSDLIDVHGVFIFFSLFLSLDFRIAVLSRPNKVWPTS